MRWTSPGRSHEHRGFIRRGSNIVDQKTQNNDKDRQSNTRKPYEPPKLFEYGDIATITHAMEMGSFADASNMVMMMMMKKG